VTILSVRHFLNSLLASIDRVVVSAVVCALVAIGGLVWHLQESQDGGRAALEHPSDLAGYLNLARGQLHSGHLEAAQHTCELAISNKFDGPEIRDLLLQSMYARHDYAGVTAQLVWGRNRPEALALHLDEIRVALAKGQIHRANTLLVELRGHQYPPALAIEYQAGLTSIARELAEAELNPASVELLKSLPTTGQDANAAVALAEDGDTAQSNDVLQRLTQAHGQESNWKIDLLPEIRAALALTQHQPQQALDTLESSAAFDRSTFAPAYLRSKAWLALAKPELAQNEFLKITEHLYVDPLSNEYPLALLASARAYVLQNQPEPARTQFERLADLWKDADEDWPLLQAVRTEYDSGSSVSISLKPD
jgi:hypothetical protein